MDREIVSAGLADGMTLAARLRAKLYDAGLYDEEAKREWETRVPTIRAAVRELESTEEETHG